MGGLATLSCDFVIQFKFSENFFQNIFTCLTFWMSWENVHDYKIVLLLKSYIELCTPCFRELSLISLVGPLSDHFEYLVPLGFQLRDLIIQPRGEPVIAIVIITREYLPHVSLLILSHVEFTASGKAFSIAWLPQGFVFIIFSPLLLFGCCSSDSLLTLLLPHWGGCVILEIQVYVEILRWHSIPYDFVPARWEPRNELTRR